MLTQILILALAAESAAIEGYVRDTRTHNGIALASVELWRAETPIQQRYTDSNGRFNLGYAAGQGYALVVEASGYETSRVNIDQHETALSLSIELVRKKASDNNERRIISLHEYMTPEKARREFDRARVETQAHGCPAAIGHFEKGLRTFDKDASAHNDLGNCYRQLGQLDRAESEFKQAQVLSDSVYVVLNLAELYTARGRFEDAEAVLLAAIQKQPNAGDAFYGLSLVYIGQDLAERAEEAALQAEKRPHQIADLHLILAAICWRKHQVAEARQQLESYLAEAPGGSQSVRVRRFLKSGFGAQ
jgi:tetratricopeptide (TPR) repeat protein